MSSNVNANDYVVLDVETNGLSSIRDDLLSISIFKPDDNKIYDRFLPLELSNEVETTYINGITKEMLKEEDEYFNYLTLELKEEWTDNKLYFLLENGDLAVHMENHRLQCIKLKNLSNEYRENIVYIVRELCSGLDEKMLRKMTKEI